MRIFFKSTLLLVCVLLCNTAYAYTKEEILNYVIGKANTQELRVFYGQQLTGKLIYFLEERCVLKYMLKADGLYQNAQYIPFKYINKDTIGVRDPSSPRKATHMVSGECISSKNQCVKFHKGESEEDEHINNFWIYFSDVDDANRVNKALKDFVLKCGGRGELY